MGIFTKNINSKKDVKNESVKSINTIGIYCPEISEKLKGKTSKINNLNLFLKEYEVIEHPYDFNLVINLYKKFGLVSAIVDKYVDFIVGSGFNIKSTDPRAVTIINKFFKDNNFESILRSWIKSALLTGNGFIEFSGDENKQPDDVKLLSSKSMFVRRDEYGKILGYSQYNEEIFASSKESIPFETYEVAHLKLNSVDDEAYGIGVIYPLLELINSLIKSRKDMHKILSRKANSPIHVKLGDDSNYATPEAVENFGKKLEFMNEKTEFSTDHLVDMKVLDLGKIGEKFKEVIEQDLQLTSIASQVPEVLLGYGNLPEGLAKEQKKAFELRAKSFQITIEGEIENKIIKRILNGAGLDVEVDFEWGEPSDEQTNKEIENITHLMNKNNLISNDLRIKLEERIAKLLNLGDIKENSKEERKREDDEKLPKIPEQVSKDNKKKVFNQKCDCGDCLTEGYDDYLLKEWIGFNYDEYTQDIINEVKNYDYKELLASNQYEEVIGKLSPEQISELKDVLEDGFRNGLSVNEISKNIENNVKPGDLIALDEQGRIKYKKDGTPALKISSEFRPYIIARTETVRAAAEGTLNNYEDNGIRRVRFACALSERTCPTCTSLDGNIFSIKEARRLIPLHVNCRCTFISIIE